MPTPTYVAIATTTVGAGTAADITFSTIPSTYTDLLVVVSGRTVGTGSRSESIYMQFNGSSAANYSNRYLQGSGATGSSGNNLSSTYIYIGEAPQSIATSNTFGNMQIYIPNYAGSTNKSVSMNNVQEDNQTTAYITMNAGLWSNTAAITSIKIYGNASNWAQYTTATLYGIKNS
jgi:hypothetical protein